MGRVRMRGDRLSFPRAALRFRLPGWPLPRVKTDSLFYAIFQSVPTLFFELLGLPSEEAAGYRFTSVEVKPTALRLDGVFLPPRDRPAAPVYFLEVQFQQDDLLYRRLFSEVLLYLRQYPAVKRWRAVVIYPRRAIEVPEPETFGEWMASSYIQVLYLNELPAISELSPGLGILRLMVEPVGSVPTAARSLIERIQQLETATADPARFVELIETSVIYALPRLSRQAIAAMLGLTDMKETRVYQEALEEGREEATRSLLQRQLTLKLGALSETSQATITQLSMEQLEQLSEALFDFATEADLQTWLAHRQNAS